MAIGVLIVAGGTVLALDQFRSDSPSPEAAVRQFTRALAQEDLLGLAESLVPGERELLRAAVDEVMAELIRLEVLAEDFDASGVAGFEIDISGLELSTEELRDDLVLVRFDAGLMTTTIDPAAVALGSFVTQFTGDDPGSPETDESDLAGSALVAVEESGRWYVSLFYTAAEAARSESGAAFPDPADALEARGEASPEAAVEAMVQAVVRFDVLDVMAGLAPAEGRVLRDYSPLFAADLRSLQRMAAFGAEVRLESLELSSTTEGSRALVRIDSVVLEADVAALGLSLRIDGDCVTFTDPAGSETVCGTDDPGTLPFFGEFGFEPPDFDIGSPELGLVVQEVDGEWFVSPLGTLTNTVVSSLAVLDRSDLDTIVAYFARFAAPFPFEEEFTIPVAVKVGAM